MRTRSPTLEGREAELGEILAALGRNRESRGSVLFITGELGIGKTRLAAEAVSRALETGMVVLQGRSSTTGPAVPFRPLAEALLGLARSGIPDLAERLGPYRQVLGRLIPEWAEPDTDATAASLVVLGEGVLRATGLAGERSGCLLVLEDLHDADVESLAVVEYLAGNLRSLPLTVVATLGPGLGPAATLAREVVNRGEGILISLSRLGPRQVRVLAAACLGTDEKYISDELADLLYADSVGNPLIVEELLHGMVSGGELVHGPDGWRVTGAPRVPVGLVHQLTQRAERLGPSEVELLSTAATFGRRFPLSLLQQVSGLGDRDLFSRLQSAVAAQLLAADGRGDDWYAFQHPLAAEALAARLPPADRVARCTRAAEVVLALHPDLPGEWCSLAASLRLAAGNRWGAVELYVLAGRRAQAAGAVGTAIDVLERAERLLGDARDDPAHLDDYVRLLRELLHALAEAGQFDRAVEVARLLHPISAGRGAAWRVELELELAWAAQVAGRWREGGEHVLVARSMLSAQGSRHDAAAVDAVDAYLTMSGTGQDRMRRSEELGRRAVEGAEVVEQPAQVCQALYVVGFAVRDRDMDESNRCFYRMLELAAEHRLPGWRSYALIGLGGNAWLAEADPAGLETARTQARRTGNIIISHNAEAVLSLHSVLSGDLAGAQHQIDGSLAEARRMKLVAITRYGLMVRAVAAAHRCDREAMRAAVAEFAAAGGQAAPEAPLVVGLAQVFCALLEEDRELALKDLDLLAGGESTWDNRFYLAGMHGLLPLLTLLADPALTEDVARAAAGSVGRMRWNRQFLAFAEVVQHGRAGRAAASEAALRQAMADAQPFPLTRHLGLRLVGQAAVEEGWGDPATWLREAEEYFHQAGILTVASACRSLLRRSGESVQQRRAGVDRVPEALRRLGITLREYEVFELLVHRPANKALAARLHISPRTVEKHIASLIQKTAMPGRAELTDYAARILVEPAD